LSATIESALRQDYGNLEILISDNDSTDESIEICRKYQKLDSRIKLYEQSENIGALENFSFLLQQASGEYFKWLASDDIISNNSISSSIKILQEKQNVKNVACSFPHLFDYDVAVDGSPIYFRLDGSEFSRIRTFFASPGRSHGVFYSLIKRDVLISYPSLSINFFAWDWGLILYLLSKGPISTAQNTLLISGSKGLSSTNDVYKHYGLTGWKRILPLRQFTTEVLETSSNWKFLARLFLIVMLVYLNFKNAFYEYRILRYKLATLKKIVRSFLKKFS
jgi:glycosyltransferase involved in cell wall biosynthesis